MSEIWKWKNEYDYKEGDEEFNDKCGHWAYDEKYKGIKNSDTNGFKPYAILNIERLRSCDIF